MTKKEPTTVTKRERESSVYDPGEWVLVASICAACIWKLVFLKLEVDGMARGGGGEKRKKEEKERGKREKKRKKREKKEGETA